MVYINCKFSQKSFPSGTQVITDVQSLRVSSKRYSVRCFLNWTAKRACSNTRHTYRYRLSFAVYCCEYCWEKNNEKKIFWSASPGELLLWL